MDEFKMQVVIKETAQAIEAWNREDVSTLVGLGAAFEAALETLADEDIEHSEALAEIFAAGAPLGIGTPIDWPTDLADDVYIAMDVTGRVLKREQIGGSMQWVVGDDFADDIELAQEEESSTP